MSALEKTTTNASIKTHPATMNADEEIEAALEILLEIALSSVTSVSETQPNE